MDQPLCISDLMAGNLNKDAQTVICDETSSVETHTAPSLKYTQIPTGVIDLQHDENSVVERETLTISHSNGIIYELESYSTDEELEAIENQSKGNLAENNNTILGSTKELDESVNCSEILSENSELTPPLLVPVENLLPQVSSVEPPEKPPSPLLYCSPSVGNSSFEVNSDIDRCFVSSDFQEDPSLPVQNQAEHMLNAVREIKTPWAKDLELRLAQEIKLDGQNKREFCLNMNGQDCKPDGKRDKRDYGSKKSNDQNRINLQMKEQNSKRGKREQRNLMKAMVEIGTPWANEIQQKNYLTQRHRGKVNYKVTGRQKKDNPPESKTSLSNSSSPKPVVKLENKFLNSVVVLNKKSSKCSLNQTKAVNIKSDLKNKKAAQKILKKAVGVSQKGKISDKNINNKLKKSTTSTKAKAKTNLKVKKTIVKPKSSAAIKKNFRLAIKNVKNVQKKSQAKEKSKVSKTPTRKPTNIVNSKISLLDGLQKSKIVKVSKTCKLPQPSTNKVPSTQNSSRNDGSALVMKNFLSNSKPIKPVKINIIESNLKNVEKVTACISSLDELPLAKQRQSIRQQVHSAIFKEIGVRKHLNFLQITFLNRHNAAYLGIQALKELKNAFVAAKQDPTCRLVLLNGSGRVFCSGVDLSLICTRDNQKIVTELTHALRDFLKSMLTFPKPIIAGVNGSAVGLGATMLPICDLIYASDKATFSTPYVKFSQVPEAGASFSFMQILGPAIASDMLLNGRILTAQEACQYGLVSQVMWPSQFMETLFPKVLNLSNESSQGMEATKQLMKASWKLQLDTHIDKECTLLNMQWNSQACQKAIMTAFHNRLHLST